MDRLNNVFKSNRQSGKKGRILFVNAGDPELQLTAQIIHLLEKSKIEAVELCVPFPNSFTDGETIQKSHKRALANGVTLDDVLDLVKNLRISCQIPIILLADFSHSVKPIGLERFIDACYCAQVDGTLVHCLPPLLLKAYCHFSRKNNLAPIFSLYPNSIPKKRQEIYKASQGFIYLVSTYGKTGQQNSFNQTSLDFFRTVRSEVETPLAVGFGVNTADDLKAIYSCGIDAAIIGSAFTKIIEDHLNDHEQMLQSLEQFLASLDAVCL